MHRSQSDAQIFLARGRRRGTDHQLDAWDSALPLDAPYSPTDKPSGHIHSDTVLCRICERAVSARLMGEHTRCCVLASQCSQEAAACDSRLSALAAKLHAKVEERKRLATPNPLTVNTLSATASVISVLSQLRALAATAASAIIPSIAAATSHASPALPVLAAPPEAMDPLDDTSLLEEAVDALESIVNLPAGTTLAELEACEEAARTLQRLHQALEAADDFSGEALVGAATTVARERVSVLEMLADAEGVADATAPGVDAAADALLLARCGKSAVRHGVGGQSHLASNACAGSLAGADGTYGVGGLSVRGSNERGDGPTPGGSPTRDISGHRVSDDLDMEGSPEGVSTPVRVRTPSEATMTPASGASSPEDGPRQTSRLMGLVGDGAGDSTGDDVGGGVGRGACAAALGGAGSGTAAGDVRPMARSNVPVPSIADFQIIRPISKGAFGRVYLARKKVTGDFFAVKVQRKDKALGRGAAAKVCWSADYCRRRRRRRRRRRCDPTCRPAHSFVPHCTHCPRALRRVRAGSA